MSLFLWLTIYLDMQGSSDPFQPLWYYPSVCICVHTYAHTHTHMFLLILVYFAVGWYRQSAQCADRDLSLSQVVVPESCLPFNCLKSRFQRYGSLPSRFWSRVVLLTAVMPLVLTSYVLLSLFPCFCRVVSSRGKGKQVCSFHQSSWLSQ